MANGDPLYYIWEAVKRIEKTLGTVQEDVAELKESHAREEGAASVWKPAARWAGTVVSAVAITFITIHIGGS